MNSATDDQSKAAANLTGNCSWMVHTVTSVCPEMGFVPISGVGSQVRTAIFQLKNDRPSMASTCPSKILCIYGWALTKAKAIKKEADGMAASTNLSSNRSDIVNLEAVGHRNQLAGRPRTDDLAERLLLPKWWNW